MPCLKIYTYSHKQKNQEKKNVNISMKEEREAVVYVQSYLTTYMVNEFPSIYMHGMF